jgi:methylmalonyl-CoA mutase
MYLAGRPGDQEAALRGAGVGEFVFAGGDALAALQQAWQRLERA